MKFEIDRSRWLRGDSERSLLLDTKGNMCCLGFYLKACGVPDEELLNVGAPDLMYYPVPEEAKWLMSKIGTKVIQSDQCSQLILANDIMPRLRDEAFRESEIIRLFAQQGVEVVFTGWDNVDGQG